MILSPMKRFRLYLWCLATVGLLVPQKTYAQEMERMFFQFDASNGLADNSAQTITCTKTGRMVITTIGHINFYDGSSFSHIDPSDANSFPLPKYDGHYHMYFDLHHHLWLKDKRSVTCLNLTDEKFIDNVGAIIRDMGMTKPVDDLFGDADNHLWIVSGDSIYGMDVKKQVPVRLSHARLLDMNVWKGSVLMQFFSNGMVAAYDLKRDRHLYDSQSLSPTDTARYDKSTVLLPDETGYYQIRNGDKESILLHYNVEQRQWRQLMAQPYHLNNMVMHQGKLYVAAEVGYWVLDVTTGQRQHIRELKLSKNRRLVTDVNTLCFDRQGGMWVGTEHRGLLYARPIISPFNTYALDSPEGRYYVGLLDKHLEGHVQQLARHVNFKFTDSRGWKWTGLYTGLECQKPGQAKPQMLTSEDGLLNEMVHSIVEDDKHDLWVSTSNGIAHLFIRKGKLHRIETYTGYDNVPVESFANGRAMRLANGHIVMQSLDHVVVFDPMAFHTSPMYRIKMFPKLVRVMVKGVILRPGQEVDGRVLLDKSPTRVKEFHVNYDQNSVNLTFSGLNYFRPIQTYYRMRVKGIYDTWRVLSYTNSGGMVDRNGMLHLPLVGMAPGRYEVELQASLSPDYWPQEPFVWIVYVDQPWWRTTGIYILLVLLLAILLAANVYGFFRNTRLRMQRHNEESETLKMVNSYVERCSSLSRELLTPYAYALSSDTDAKMDLSKDFVSAMMKIVPYVNQREGKIDSVRELANVAGVEPNTLYEQLSKNLYKSPRPMALFLRVQEGEQLLRTTDLSVEDIAERCLFVSPNFFIASFYHQFRQTPAAYRKSMPR